MTPPLTQGRLFLVHATVSAAASVGASALQRCPQDHPHPYTGEAEVCSKPSSALNGEIKFTILLAAKHSVAVFNA